LKNNKLMRFGVWGNSLATEVVLLEKIRWKRVFLQQGALTTSIFNSNSRFSNSCCFNTKGTKHFTKDTKNFLCRFCGFFALKIMERKNPPRYKFTNAVCGQPSG
jgi:hypothetical protein